MGSAGEVQWDIAYMTELARCAGRLKESSRNCLSGWSSFPVGVSQRGGGQHCEAGHAVLLRTIEQVVCLKIPRGKHEKLHQPSLLNQRD